jgi:glycosyltransferase A (GT-A) superfamily protein (DUF2064 family)
MSLTDIESIHSSKLSEIKFFNHQDIVSINILSHDFHVQPEGTFGERMKSSIKWAFAKNFDKLIVLGADSPQIQPSIINETVNLLNTYDVVLGPSAEGGIYLIGIKPNLLLEGFEKIFKNVELSWFAKFANNQSLSFYILQEVVDIDLESDLIGLIAWLDSIEIQLTLFPTLSKNEQILIPKKTLEVIRKIGLTITVDEKNNRQKKLKKINSVS